MTRFIKVAAATVAAGFLARSASAQVVDATFLVNDWSTTSTPDVFPFTIISAAPQSPEATGTYTYPDTEYGSFTGSKTSYGGNAAYDNFAQLQNAVDSVGPGTLSISMNGQISTYSYKLDLSGINPASLPAVQITSPAENAYVGNKPLFQWTDSNIASLDVQLLNLETHQGTSQVLPATQTSWSPSASLASGSYGFSVSVYGNTLSVPLNPELTSGPDVGVPQDASFYENVMRGVDFTVVPEPSCLALSVLVPAVLLRRRRR